MSEEIEIITEQSEQIETLQAEVERLRAQVHALQTESPARPGRRTLKGTNHGHHRAQEIHEEMESLPVARRAGDGLHSLFRISPHRHDGRTSRPRRAPRSLLQDRRVLPGGAALKREPEERPPFVLPLTFGAADIAVAFGRSLAWAWEFLAELELKGLVERVKPGKYKFCWRRA